MSRTNLQPVTVRTGDTPLPPRHFPYVAYAANNPQAVEYQLDTSGDEPVEWTEEDVVFLHCLLLDELNGLADPATPLEEKLDTLRWVFTEREKDGLPFSFVNCLRVVGCSPLSPIAYCGLVDAEEIRSRIRHDVKQWLEATLTRYPEWVREAVARNPEWVELQLARNPQWINQQVRAVALQGDLFA